MTHPFEMVDEPLFSPTTRRSFLAGAAASTLLACSPDALTQSEAENNAQVYELRQYTLYGGKRDVLISLFEQNFIDSQIAVGSRVLATFRDLDDPDRFVWLRSFKNMQDRARALQAFYGGPVWQAHRSQANATMVDSDNVLLLRPVPAEQRFAAEPGPGTTSIFGAFIYYLGVAEVADFLQFFDADLRQRLSKVGIKPLFTLGSEQSANNFPKLPVREHDRTFLLLCRFQDLAALNSAVEKLHDLSGWRDKAPEKILPAFMRKPELLRLQPTMHSPLR